MLRLKHAGVERKGVQEHKGAPPPDRTGSLRFEVAEAAEAALVKSQV
jgi:hypothetical protein